MINFWYFLACFSILYVLFLAARFYLKNRKTEYEFTSIINHTFRTPLTRIKWISKELETIDLPRDERILHLQNLNNATNKLLEIIDLIVGARDINKASNYYLTETSFRDIVEKSISKYREEISKKNIGFKVSSFSDIPQLTLDIKKITFVVDTIIENAITYTPKDGKILIDCIFKKKKGVLFYVGDTGIGLSFYDKYRLFTRFFRSKSAILSYPDGMGLHLYLAKHIIKKHNGELYAKSKGRNMGTVFFVKLPLRQ